MDHIREPRPFSETVAVVLNWNGADDTVRCVEALLRSRPAPPRIIVVDNGSEDGSAGLVREQFPGVELIEVESNLGYAGGNNLGIRRALESGAGRVVLLNNDVEVEPDCIVRLAEAMQTDREIGVAGPIILAAGSDDRIWAAGGELSHRENVTRLRGYGRVLDGAYRSDENVDYLPGCVIMVRRDVFEKVGLLEESFFCYMEDVDFGRRVEGAGFHNRFIAEAVAYHKPSSSTGGGYSPARKYMNAVNSIHFLRRHGDWKSWLGFILFDLLGLPAAFLVALAHGRPGAAVAKMRGIFDGLRGVTVTPERVERYFRESR